MAFPNVFSFNMCSNPSFEQDLSGVSAVNGASFLQDTTLALYGSQSLLVSTPGNQANEGVILPPGTVLASSTGAVSFYLQANTPSSSGTLNVFAVDLTNSTTLGSTTVSFDNTTSWQRVQITGLALVNTHNIAVYVETSSIQATAFNIDGVQYEPGLTLNGGVLPTPYIDGYQPFGSWAGTPNESASSKPFQNQIGATGSISTFGAGTLLARGAIFNLVFSDATAGPTQIAGNIDLSGKPFTGLDNVILSGGGSMTITGMTMVLMLAGMDNFAIFQAGDIDPAQSLVGYNNAGVASGTNTSGSAGYTRPFATFSAPTAFQGSTGKNIWNAAAYFAVGYQFGSMTSNEAQNITHVQAELVPPSINTGNTTLNPVTPTAYTRPRALTATLAPTQVNYVPNPSFQFTTNNWVAIGGGLTRDTTVHLNGTASGKVVAASASQGAYAIVPNLIVGETYTASAQVFVNATGISGIEMAVGSQSSTGSLALNSWRPVSLTFTATASNICLAFTPSVAATFWIDSVMIQPGGALNAYADGNSLGWAWGGAVGESISYYYQRANIAYASIQSVLAAHLPLGLHAYAPQFFAPVTQYN